MVDWWFGLVFWHSRVTLRSSLHNEALSVDVSSLAKYSTVFPGDCSEHFAKLVNFAWGDDAAILFEMICSLHWT